jgi:redox-sensitive bicupin YhaK (pirin superfamily)
MHERAFARQGGTFRAIQLWVNLPRASKMSAPRYQSILDADIPAVPLEGDAGVLRVIAGSLHGRRGPARTVTPVELYDVRLRAGGRMTVPLPEGHNTAAFVLQGRVAVNGSHQAGEAELVLYQRQGSSIGIEALEESRLLIMSGEPIDEPIARYGPFVMNTKAELIEAVQDYQAGRMGHLA